jgi:lysophospholipase L1-like esterase
MRELDYMLDCKDYDLVIFNNGLHGFDISDEVYEENLEEVIKDLNKRVKKLAWRTSTPIRDKEDLNKFNLERTPRVIRRNVFAAKVTAELNIPVLDLYTPMAENVEYFSTDAVHYNEEGREAQAKILAEFIKEII